jgi:hypothetical protein
MVKSQEKVNGDRETTTQAVISMKEIIVEVAKMVLASSNGPLEIIIRVNFWMMIDMGMGRCTGLMRVAIKASGSKALCMATVGWFSLMGPRKKVTSKTTFIKETKYLQIQSQVKKMKKVRRVAKVRKVKKSVK